MRFLPPPPARAKRLFEEERREIQRGLESCIFSTDTFATPFKAAAEQQQASAGAAAAAPPRPSGAARYDRAAGGASGAHCDDGATAVPRPQQQQVMPFGSPPHTSSSSSWLNADPHHFHQALQPFMHHADLMLASELFPDVIPPSALALGAAAAKLQQQHHTPMAPDAPVAYHQQTALTQQHASGRQL